MKWKIAENDLPYQRIAPSFEYPLIAHNEHLMLSKLWFLVDFVGLTWMDIYAYCKIYTIAIIIRKLSKITILTDFRQSMNSGFSRIC